MITVTNLAKSYGARTLFEGVSLKLVEGARYGLVGANGSGKTTLLSILAGFDQATEGSVSIPKEARLGVLRQDRFLDDDAEILGLAMAGDALVWGAIEEQKKIVDSPHPDAARLAELEDVIAAHDGYTLEARASAILEGLGIPVPSHRRPLSTLSGGFKLRVLLAQVLLGGPDVLLLDEPTNHLDILSIRWLEKFLAGYRGCAIVISHDARFLDNVATHVLDVDYGTVTRYVGNYSAFVAQKSEERTRKEGEIARAEEIVADKRAFVERFRYKASKARQAQSILKQIDKIEIDELADSSRRAPKFRFTPQRPSGRDVLEVAHVSKAYGENTVLRDVSVIVRRGERLAILGPNGLGKSTLLKIVTGGLASDAGTVKWGHEAHVGYFPQDHAEVLRDPNAKPLETIWNLVPKEGTTFVRGELGKMLFSGADVEKRVASLSGGEAARLVFCKLIVERPNVLVLDEPTNHLDLESIAALVEALKAFDGTLVFVSHDRAFVSALATRILEVTKQGFRDFPGSYEEYLAKCGDDHLDAEAVVLRAKKARTTEPPPGKKEREKEKEAAPAKKEAAPTLSWEEQKKRANRWKQLPARRDETMKAIDRVEARRKELLGRFGEPEFYTRTKKEEIAAMEAEAKKLGEELAALMRTWESIEEELARGE